MVKINGVKATNSFETQKQKDIKPSINEILSRMETNYQNVHNVKSENYNSTPKSNINNSNISADIFNESEQNTSPASQGLFSNILGNVDGGIGNADNNLLLSILPMMLTKNKGANTLKNSQNMIFKEILKNSKNSRLKQIAELLPKIMQNNSPQMFNTETEIKTIENKIDTFKKTDEYED